MLNKGKANLFLVLIAIFLDIIFSSDANSPAHSVEPSTECEKSSTKPDEASNELKRKMLKMRNSGASRNKKVKFQITLNNNNPKECKNISMFNGSGKEPQKLRICPEARTCNEPVIQEFQDMQLE